MPIFAFQGLIMVRLNAAQSNNNTTTTPMPTTPQLTPLTGYGHFNVTDKNGNVCLLLDISCSVTAQLQVNSTVSMCCV